MLVPNFSQPFFFQVSIQTITSLKKKKKDQITELGGQRKHFDEKRNNSASAENS